MFIGIQAGKQSAATRLLLCNSLVMHIRASCHCVDKLTYDSPGTLYYTIDLYHCCFPKWVTQYGLVLHYHTPPPSPRPPANEVWGHTGFILSACPSVRLQTNWCPLCIFHNTSRIDFNFTPLISHLRKVCRVLSNFSTRRIAEAPDGRRRIQRQNFDSGI